PRPARPVRGVRAGSGCAGGLVRFVPGSGRGLQYRRPGPVVRRGTEGWRRVRCRTGGGRVPYGRTPDVTDRRGGGLPILRTFARIQRSNDPPPGTSTVSCLRLEVSRPGTPCAHPFDGRPKVDDARRLRDAGFAFGRDRKSVGQGRRVGRRSGGRADGRE